MATFLYSLAAFVIAHVIPAVPAVRNALIARWGLPAYVAAYSVMSLLLFVFLIRSALNAPVIPLWPPSAGAFLLAVIFVPLALMLLGASAAAPNPLSVAFVGGDYVPERPGAVAFTRHPVLWGLGLWGLAHVPANGNLVALILFGGLGVFAVIGMLVMDRRRRASLGTERWQGLAAGTSFIPGVALLTGRARLPRDAKTWAGAILGALLALFLLLGGHLWLFQRDPLAFF